MKKIILTILLCLIVLNPNFAQSIDTVWTKYIYGVEQGLMELAVDDENSIIAISSGVNDLPYVYKFSENGDSLWRTKIRFSDIDERDIDVRDVAVGKNGNYLVLSTISIYGTGAEYDDQSLISILSPEGEIVDSAIIGNGRYYYLKYVVADEDGGFTLAGGSFQNLYDENKLQVVRVDYRGTVVEEHAYDILGDCVICEGLDLTKTKDKGYLIGGKKFIIKLDSNYNQVWLKNEGFYSYKDFHIVREADDNTAFVVFTEYQGNNYNNLFKIDENGDTLWVKTLDHEDWTRLYLQDGVVLEDGSIMLSGAADTHGSGAYRNVLILVDKDGNIITDYIYNDNWAHYYSYVERLRNGDFVTTSTGNRFDGLVIRYSLTQVGVGENESAPTEFELLQNYPNPFSAKGGPTTNITYVIARSGATRQSIGNSANASNTTDCHAPLRFARNDGTVQVLLKIYDALGREVTTLVNKEQASGNYSVQFNANYLPSGVYFYTLRANGFVQTRKMVLIK